MSALASYQAFVTVFRSVLLYVAIAVAIVCTIDWAIRARHISPFNRIARFFRSNIDPLMQPVERVILRRGGVPSQAPWWTLAAVIVGGILLLSLLQFAGGILAQILFGFSDPARLPKLLLSWVFSLLRLALLVRVLSSWLPISPYSKWIRWSYVTTEWMISPLQRIIPRFGMVDITPIVAWLLLNLLQGALEI